MGKLKRSFYKKLMQFGFVHPEVILLMDGGICSQMHQYLLGQLYAEKGYLVCFDVSFFQEWGSDLNRKFVRNFDLLKAFPYLHFDKASKMAVDFYKRKCYFGGNNSGTRIDDFSFLQFTPPVYLGGYYHLPPEIWLKTFRSLFKMTPGVLDNSNEELCKEIKDCICPVAVHVRRGDLSVDVYAYGKPASFDYFKKAVRFFEEKLLLPYFYFFSDEPSWVEKELISNLSLNDNFKVIDINGSDKGYMDLFLIAHCRHCITSKGTLGKYGALLGDDSNKYVILCDDETEYVWKNLFQHPIFL
ncbi:alpha-1,2-fucosyltransferase [Jilunia laotingensis]|jgi:hypothetical protein|nr:alpha-1,2-fucosyltransferase [Jilunia laotingensis]